MFNHGWAQMRTDGVKLLVARFEVWRQASVPVVAGGCQPFGLRLAREAETGIPGRLIVAARNPPGWKPGSQDGRRYDSFRLLTSAATGSTELFW